MASNTPNLDLYKKDPLVDGNDTFNIETMLNENWDKIDESVGDLDDKVTAHLDETVSKVVMITEPFDQITKTTVNLGFKPKSIIIDALIQRTEYKSTGYFDGNTSAVKYRIVEDANDNISVYAVLFQYDGTSNQIYGVVTFTNDGIEINWTKSGSLPGVTGNRRLIISAFTHGEG